MTPKTENRKPLASTKGFSLRLEPATAWTAILGLIFFTVLLALVGAGKILNLAFPLASFAVGVMLYLRYPVLYLGFTWWMWLLTPFVRRLADRGSGFTDPSPILLSPYLVVLVTCITLWRHPFEVRNPKDQSFLLSFIGILYGFCIGLILNSPFAVFKGLLNWICPFLFGFHLYKQSQNYPSYRQNIQRVFIWAVLLLGSYGIFQYLVLPEWDRLWLENVQAIISAVSFGTPEPGEFRVFSTMHDMGTFGGAMAIGLLLLFNQKGTLPICASIVGYLSLLLTSSRAAWVTWVIGFLTLTSSLKTKYQIRLVIIAIVIALCVVPLTMIDTFSGTINDRLETLTDLGNDNSAEARQGIYEYAFNRLATNFVGDGIGSESPAYESPLLYPLIELGWLGGTCYMGGLLLFFIQLCQGTKVSSDLFLSSTRAIEIAVFTQICFTPIMTKPFGIFVWGFLGINLAGNQYYRDRRKIYYENL